jgi:hypothetical protein
MVGSVPMMYKNNCGGANAPPYVMERGEIKRMSKFTYTALQTIPGGGNALLTDTDRRCGKCRSAGLTDTGVVRLLGASSQPCARYGVRFGANVAIPTGGTAGPITIALVVDGVVLPSSIAIVTPAAVGDFWHITIDDVVDVAYHDSTQIAVRNTGTDEIEMQNAVLIVNREA